MKRRLPVLIVAVLCMVLCSCASGAQKRQNLLDSFAAESAFDASLEESDLDGEGEDEDERILRLCRYHQELPSESLIRLLEKAEVATSRPGARKYRRSPFLYWDAPILACVWEVRNQGNDRQRAAALRRELRRAGGETAYDNR